ncbi:MAG: ATP-binding protein [Sulfuricellaceae bacterium]
MATHALPDQLTPDSVPFLACLDAIYQDSDKQVTFDCTQVRFVTPFGLCLMAATFDWLEQEDKQVGHTGLSPSVGSYLARMDCLPEALAEPFVGPRNNRADALVEVQVISERSEADVAAQKLAQAFVGRLPGTDSQAIPDEMTGLKPGEAVEEALTYIFTELIDNSLTHGRNHGFPNAKVWVAAQYYSSKDHIRLAVVDNGCGLFTSLRNHPRLTDKTDIGAIKLALEPRVSGNRDVGLRDDSHNQGVGLSVSSELAIRASGRVDIISGQGAVKKLKNALHSWTVPGWHGTAIEITVLRKQLGEVRVSDLIRELPGYEQVSMLKFT